MQRFFGFENKPVSHAEKLVSSVGAVIGISLIAFISFHVTGASGAALIVPSMGASAVLVFAVPHGKLSQPWALFGGHLLSAVMGVVCARYVADVFVAAGLAVGLAIAAMHVFDCIHPPGGATALAAVIGGPAIQSLGFNYALTPILLNTSIIFMIAVVFNYAFSWRRYPVSLMRFTDTPGSTPAKHSHLLEKEYIERALADMDVVVDLTSSDLQQIFTLAMEHAQTPYFLASQIKLGHFYTNNKHGGEWSVRQVIDESSSDDAHKDMVIYKIVEGQGLRSADSCTRSEFAKWAVRELFPNSPHKSE